MLMCGDEHSRNDFVSLVRHNHGYADPNLLAEHRELIRILAKSVGGEVAELRNRRFDGFEVHFRSAEDTERTIPERSQIAVANGTSDTWKACWLAFSTDAQASIADAVHKQIPSLLLIAPWPTSVRSLNLLYVWLVKSVSGSTPTLPASVCKAAIQGRRSCV